MAETEAPRKPVSVFDEFREKAEKKLYIIQGNNKGRHIFRAKEYSMQWNSVAGLTPDQIKAQIPGCGSARPGVNELLDETFYEESVIGQCDDDGLVGTENKELAKLIFKEYKSFDPKARIHPHSKEFDPEEKIDWSKVKRTYESVQAEEQKQAHQQQKR